MNRVVTGGCHCQSVRFELDLNADEIPVQTCNCSICKMSGLLHMIVSERRFRLLKGKEQLTHYRFNTHTADHMFCSVCGIKSFYRPRSNPDGWSVNALCLDDKHDIKFRIEAFDGRNWEAHGASLAHLSLE